MTLLYGPDGKPISKLDAPSAESTKDKRGSKNKPRRRIGKRNYLGAILAIVTLVGFPITLLTLYPRLSVSNESQIDPNDPFSTPFRIVNEGYVPLTSVKFLLAVNEINPWSLTAAGLKGGPHCSSRFEKSDMSTKVFWPSDVFTYYSGAIIDNQAGPIAFADICIVVQYRPFGLPLKRERKYRFITQPGPDNRVHWMQRPESE